MAGNDTHGPSDNHDNERASHSDDTMKQLKGPASDKALLVKASGSSFSYLGPLPEEMQRLLYGPPLEKEPEARSNKHRTTLRRGIIIGTIAVGAIALAVVILLLTR
jgi:hypothetical protein